MRSRLARWLTVAALAVALAGCGDLDRIALVDPGSGPVEARTGDFRVLRHDDDPTQGDAWIVVLPFSPDVAVDDDVFREADSRDIPDDEPGDLRRVVEMIGAGRSILVEVNCRACAGGVPVDDADLDVLVWEVVVDDDRTLHLADAAATGTASDRVVGEYVVVVFDGSEPDLLDVDDEILRRVGAGRSHPDGMHVEVFVAVSAGTTEVVHQLPDGERSTHRVLVR